MFWFFVTIVIPVTAQGSPWVLAEPLRLEAGQILENRVIDARKIDGPAIIIGKSTLAKNVRIRNVQIIHAGDSEKDVGVLFDADQHICSFNRIEATIRNAQIGVKFTGTKYWSSGNTLDLVLYGCKRSVDIQGRTSQNRFNGHVHPGPVIPFLNIDRGPEVGVYCNARSHIIDLHFWDWQKHTGKPAIHFDEKSRRNQVRQRFQNHHIFDKVPQKLRNGKLNPGRNRWREQQ